MSKTVLSPLSATSVLVHFADLEDPRMNRTRRHELIDIVVVALCGVISGAESWVQVEKFGKNKRAWLETFLELPNGIPAHDTFGRVFAQLDPDKFHNCFANWINTLHKVSNGRIVPIDGKTMRHSFAKAKGQSPLHVVSAWAAQQHLVLGQVAVADKSNEITAIPELLKLLDLHGAIVTIDAMGCQKEIAQDIVDGGGDYVLAVKGNQEKLQEAVLATMEKGLEEDFEGMTHTIHSTHYKGHGREEERTYYAVQVPADFPVLEQWPELKSICMAVRTTRPKGEAEETRVRYYISSLQAKADMIGEAIRSHWTVENGLHWVLDVSFREDECRIRKDHGPENMGMLRRLALSLLKKATFLKGGIQTKRLQAGWNEEILTKVLVGG
jgi:predicted transposase YbfD/YdcC